MRRSKDKSTASRPVTRNDVAAAAKTSPTVVSWVMNNVARENRVSAKTIKRVQRAAERLNYRADVWGKILRTRKSGIVGFVSPHLTDPNTTEFFRVLGPATRRRNLSLMVLENVGVHGAGWRKRDTAQKSGSNVACEAGFCEAFLLHVPSDELLGQVSRKGLFMDRPCCVIGRNVDQEYVASVEVDNRAGAGMAIAHLVETGAASIGIIADHRNLPYTCERIEGVKAARHESKNKGRYLTYYRRAAENQYEAGISAIRKWCEAEKLPQGIFAMGDVMALGALFELNQRGIRCPGRVRIIGFDGTMLAQYSSPPLSTIAQPYAAMVEAALDTVMATTRKLPVARHKEILKPTLIKRRSTAGSHENDQTYPRNPCRKAD